MTRSAASNPLPHAERFDLGGEILAAEPWGSGHINDTWRLRLGHAPDCLLQRINTHVFRDPVQLMENVRRVTAHIRRALEVEGLDTTRRVLRMIPTRRGGYLLRDADGGCWRCYLFIDGARSFNRSEHPGQIENAARAFARFHKHLSDLPGSCLHQVIPGFGDARRRFDAFREEMIADRMGRAGGAEGEIAFALERKTIVPGLAELQESCSVPERVIHFDTKLNNVLFDNATGEGLCVIDLDTVMPGTILYDFGDLARSGTARCLEDEPDISRAGIDLELFASLARGYLSEARSLLVPTERDHLVFAARHVTYTMGLRFLTDYLAGDVYFKTERDHQNLDRCRTQFAMVTDMEEKADRMDEIIADAR